ncbi:MAG: metallophosphoesterase family protein [Candidatus Gastranaerophilales bacterium]|nr:metallophosphoesterase family protein [Candidatus Gastranaerophilales bacterium]
MVLAAVISDIHGNMEALEAVFADIRAQEIKNIFVLGDLALFGGEPNEAIDFIRGLSNEYNTKIIQGNTDLMLIQGASLPSVMQNALDYDRKILRSDNVEFLAGLPETMSVMLGKTSILLVHGSPRKNDESILPGKDIKEIIPMIEGVKEALILCGHTHFPAGYQIEDKTVVNVGSVGRPFTQDQRSCYLVINADEEKENSFSLEHRFIKYDAQKAAEKLAKQDFEGAKALAEMLRKSTNKFVTNS